MVEKEIKIDEIFAEMSDPNLRKKVYKKPNVDIYDEERNEKIAKEFMEAGEIEVRQL